MLVRDEDIFVERAVRNVAEFCDHLIAADHRSTDGTRAILENLKGEIPVLTVVDINTPAQSHGLVEKYAGSDTWIFAVDGDEIYDPEGLARLRARLESGEFDATWRVYGNVLNCVDIDYQSMTAKGHLSPPCRSMTKLFNFGAIDSWSGDCPERLHGGEVRFKPGYDDGKRRNLHKENDWESSDFRCLHVCFMRRSSREGGNGKARRNIMEFIEAEKRSGLRSVVDRLLRRPGSGSYKHQKYRRGPLVDKRVEAFLRGGSETELKPGPGGSAEFAGR